MTVDQNATRLYCPNCKAFHPARLVEEHNCMFWRVACPTGTRDVRISSDAALFRKFRAQGRSIPDWYRKTISNCILHINDDCSLHCPICFEDAGRKGWRMSLDEVRDAARKIAARNPVNVMLIGGEPADHPQLPEILRILTKEFGFRCSMLTNGVRLGTQADFARLMKASGLCKASISFDAFDPDVSKIMRGREDLVAIKQKAVENCIAAGMQFSLVTTASRANLSEIPKIVDFVIRHARWSPMYEIQCYQEAGRVVPGLESVDREEVVKEIVASGVVPGLTVDDFRVSPPVPAAGYCIHPDCGAGLFWIVKEGKAVPVNHRFAFDAFMDRLYRMKPAGRRVKWLRLFLLGIRYFGWRFVRLLRGWSGRPVRGNEHLQLLSISGLMTPEKLDGHRFCHCTNGVLTKDGLFQSPCYYYGLTYEKERGGRT